MNNDFLDDEDRKILAETFGNEVVEDFFRFWSHDKIQLDGEFSLHELEKLVEAMQRMKKRHDEMKP